MGRFGINEKAVEARARKEQQKREKQEKERKAKEDALWAETDKKILAKQQKKQEEEQKRLQEQKRKAERKALEEKERNELAKKYGKPKGSTSKVTQFALEQQRLAEQKAKELAKKKAEVQSQQLPTENINRILAEEKARLGDALVEARTVEDAIAGLSEDKGVDRHPEKRMKAAFKAYEEANLPILRQENPSLKLSQLKDMLWKQWQKAPENPLNQAALAAQQQQQ